MKLLALLLLVAFTVLVPASLEAAQSQTADGHVVHTNPIPVMLHRAVPPYRGVHVYQGRAGGRR